MIGFFLGASFEHNIFIKALITVIDKTPNVRNVKEHTQKKWIRKNTQERCDLIDQPIYEEKKSFIQYCFNKLKMTDEVLPKRKNYDYIVIHGAMTNTMQARINFFKKIQPIIQYKQIVFLSGERMLDPQKEPMNSTLKTEADAAEYLMKKNGFKQFIVINAKKFKGVRPNTKDTIMAWKDTHPQPGSILAISNNPYIQRQDLTLKKEMREFDIETVGPKASTDKASIFFDEAARLIYEEQTP